MAKKHGGARARTKGRRGEQECVRQAKAHGLRARRLLEYDGRGPEHGWDVIIEGEVLVQCKTRKRIAWIREVLDSIAGSVGAGSVRLPVWRFKTDRQEPVIVLLESDFLGLIKNLSLLKEILKEREG